MPSIIVHCEDTTHAKWRERQGMNKKRDGKGEIPSELQEVNENNVVIVGFHLHTS